MSDRKTDRLDRMRKMLMTENGITIREFAGKLDVSEICLLYTSPSPRDQR